MDNSVLVNAVGSNEPLLANAIAMDRQRRTTNRKVESTCETDKRENATDVDNVTMATAVAAAKIPPRAG